MPRSFLAAAAVLLLATPALAQSDSFDEAVLVPLNHYLMAHATGDGSYAERAFHTDAKLFWIADGEVRQRTAAEYIAGFRGEPADNEAERERRIVSVHVAGDAATAVIELDYPGARFTDYMTLLRIGDAWTIVNKAFYVDRTE